MNVGEFGPLCRPTADVTPFHQPPIAPHLPTPNAPFHPPDQGVELSGQAAMLHSMARFQTAQNSTPGWPLMPARKGCLTSVISVTRSAASISGSGALRPVSTTWVRDGFSAARKASTASTSR